MIFRLPAQSLPIILHCHPIHMAHTTWDQPPVSAESLRGFPCSPHTHPDRP
uniref:Uncharacterized protein n=1 Tax=Anguilla anguilla TaxID=7936 RepID=A0A0E9SZ77_ANGAN